MLIIWKCVNQTYEREKIKKIKISFALEGGKV